jgi:hypothetical protein
MIDGIVLWTIIVVLAASRVGAQSDPCDMA